MVSPAAINDEELPKTKANASTAVSIFFITYFFLYPVGHFGFTAVTFFDVFPFTHVIVVFLAAIGAKDALGDGEGVDASCVSFTRTVGDEKVNPDAVR
jgi:hypothetical protein